MPDQKITQLTELTIPNPADMYPVIDDPAGTPITKKISGSNMLKTLADGWMIHDATWTYASASTFTVAGDLTAIFQKGTFLKWTQTTVKYGVVASSSYSAPNTTVTIIINTDYTIANAAITEPYISYAANPQGWPGWFNWTPTFTGFSVNPTGNHKYCVINKTMFIVVVENIGTSNSTGFTMTLPSNPAAYLFCFCVSVDNGARLANPGILETTTATATLYSTIGGGVWTNSGGKSVAFSLNYPL